MACYEEAAVAFLQCLALDQKVASAKDYLSKVDIFSGFSIISNLKCNM